MLAQGRRAKSRYTGEKVMGWPVEECSSSTPPGSTGPRQCCSWTSCWCRWSSSGRSGRGVYLLSALFGLLFAWWPTLAAATGTARRASSSSRGRRRLTALGFGIGGEAWGWLVLAAFAVTLTSGLAVAFGVRRFVTALLTQPVVHRHPRGRLQFPSSHPHHQLRLGPGARVGRRGGAVDRGDVHRVASPRSPGAAPSRSRSCPVTPGGAR